MQINLYLPELGPVAVPAEEGEQHQQQQQRGGPEHGERGGEGGQLAGPGRGRGRGAGQHPHPGSSVGEGRVWIQGYRWPPAFRCRASPLLNTTQM